LSHQNLFVAAYVFAGVALLLAIWAVYGYFSQTFGHTGEHYELLDKFDRFVIVNNPVSTDSFRLKERLRELTQLKPGSEIIVFDTVPGGRAANAELFVRLGDKLGPTTLVCIAGGDGTTNMVIDALMRHPSLSDGARKSPIFPLWCGNANDLAYILSGPPTRHPIHKVFRRGGVIRVRPLECTFTTGGKQTSYLAACYASFGASAFATMEMERTLRKKSPIRRFVVSRFGQEVIAAAWALMRAPTFAVSENGQRRVIFERTHFNGSRFAKIIGLPLRLTDERFHRATIEHKHLVSLVLRVLGLVGDRDLAKKTITRDEFTVHDDVWAQFDGEAVHIPADTAVEVRVSKHQFYAISTRLNR
jgi:diacylglycerol kinase family enzyme